MTDRRIARARLARLASRRSPRLRRLQGWQAGPPDFVGVGAQRAGTTWWFRLLVDHPEVAAPYGKERHFFDPFAHRDFDAAAIDRYRDMFPRPAGTITGEWTPRYMYDPWVPSLIRRAAPDAAILVMLRDPWERFQSGLAHETRALARELRGRRAEYLRAMIAHDALSRSLYSSQIERLIGCFGSSGVLVLQYERCAADPFAEFGRTCEFLGVDAGFKPTLPPPGPPRAHRFEVPVEFAGAARELIAGDLQRLGETVVDLDLALWPSAQS